MGRDDKCRFPTLKFMVSQGEDAYIALKRAKEDCPSGKIPSYQYILLLLVQVASPRGESERLQSLYLSLQG